jgi:hypothetical protein
MLHGLTTSDKTLDQIYAQEQMHFVVYNKAVPITLKCGCIDVTNSTIIGF